MTWQLPQGDTKALIIVAGGLLVGGLIVTRWKKLITEDLNPTSRENFVYQGIADETGTVRMMDSFFAYTDLLHPDAERRQQARNYLEVYK